MQEAAAVNAVAELEKRAGQHELVKSLTLNGTAYDYQVIAKQYGRELGTLLTPPEPDVLEVTTLTGFRDAIASGKYPSDGFLIHVADHLYVDLVARETDQWGRRVVYLRARHEPITAFNFDEYYSDPQRFIIAIQAQFLQTKELLYVIRIASNMKAGKTIQTQDDGFSQTVVLKAGEVETAEVKVEPRIKLIALRTFPEASEVMSEFLLRLRETPQGTPAIALFDIDGGKWKGDSMRSIKSWLEKQPELTNYKILA